MAIRHLRGVANPSGAPSEKYVCIFDRLHKWDGSRRCIIVPPGHNGDAVGGVSAPQWMAGARVYGDLAAAQLAGLPMLAIDDGGGQTFGNDVAIARIGEAIAWVASSGYGKADKVILSGSSMGSLASVNYAARNPSKVAALALFYPAMDMAFIHGNGYNTEIDAAYGGSAGYTAALPTHDPITQAQSGTLDGIPVHGWYSTNDTVVSTSAWTNFKNALVARSQAVGETSLGAVGHGDMTVTPTADITAFYGVNT
jgi:pimeloyl-ACP methyl ester carboxylesterase